jgi:hypothetical protein
VSAGSAGDPHLRLDDEVITWREVDGETLLLDKRRSTYLSVNGTATVLWRLLAAGTSESALVDALVAGFDVDATLAAADVETFLADCRARGYLRSADDGT